MARAHPHDAVFGLAGSFAHLLFGQGRRIHLVEEARAPVGFAHVQLAHMVVLVQPFHAVGGVHEFVMRRVDTVLDGALVIDVPFEFLDGGCPALLAPLVYLQDGGALVFFEVTKEAVNQAVALRDGVGVHPCAARRLGFHPDRRHAHTLACAVEAPAVIRTLHATVGHQSIGQRTAAMAAGIAQAMGLAFLVAP